jgi:hypothetical protein
MSETKSTDSSTEPTGPIVMHSTCMLPGVNGNVKFDVQSKLDLSKPRIKLDHLNMTTDACPTQWKGRTVDDKDVYLRYRFGSFTARINDELFMVADCEHSMDGCMSTEQMQTLTALLFDWKGEDDV